MEISRVFNILPEKCKSLSQISGEESFSNGFSFVLCGLVVYIDVEYIDEKTNV